MWILVILTVLISQQCALQALSDTTINEMDDAIYSDSVNASIHPGLLLLRIQIETCGQVRWCTINLTTTKAKQTCCKACSCDTNCKHEDSCCPDYDFGKLNDWPKYNSVSVFSEEFSWWTSLTDSGNDRNPKLNYNGTQQCVRPQAQKSTKLREEAGAYYMTSTCLSDDVDPEVKQRCEFDFYNNPVDPDNLPSFDDLTPVQSLVDGTIYKNKYCSACSANDQETRPWIASALCVHNQLSYLDYIYFPNPNSILRTMLLYMFPQTIEMVKLHMCNIIFEPSEDQAKVIQHHRCTKYDFEGCENNANTTVESELCERYMSPVHVYSDDYDRILTVYKNVACLKCLKSPVTHRQCSDAYNSRRHKMEMFVPREMAKISATDYMDDVLHEVFPGDPKHGCKTGEIHDAISVNIEECLCTLKSL